MSSTESAPITVAILNWNGRHWLEQFLPQVVEHSRPLGRVLVVDNASTDDSVDWLRQHYSQTVQVEVLDRNHGFAGGYNRSLSFIHTPYFVLLNSDVAVTPDWLQPLYSWMEEDAGLIGVQPKILAQRTPTHFEYAGAAGGYLDVLCYPLCRGRIFETCEQDQGQYNTRQYIFWATGACSLVRTQAAWELGLFDERFFAHMEEIDFYWRAQNSGWRVGVEPASVVYHVGGGALDYTSPFKAYLNFRNSLVAMLKNLPLGQAIPKLFLRMVLDGIAGAKGLLQGNWRYTRAILRAHGAFYSWLPETLRLRRQQQQRPLGQLDGVYRGSAVWQYFARGRRTFRELFGPNP